LWLGPVDVRNGLASQTYRHTRIAALLGIRRVLLVINKMDPVGFAESAFTAIRNEYEAFAATLGLAADSVPAVAPDGDNVVRKSSRMPWYAGPTLVRWLESVEVAPRRDTPLRFWVQGREPPKREFPRICRPRCERRDRGR
jgi:bifunctional enzyme CysN/CysC